MAHSSSSSFHPEIQGLRAIAVSIVLIFHVWPGILPGGYIGVDVFFVISGYLITGLLLREAQHSGRISLVIFYKRRIRRLLPAAALVIIVSCLFVGVLPSVQWADTAKEALASTFYLQNWWLAYQAVDYLAEDSAPGLLRHYWSLSVEEQYYIFWPLLYILIATFGSWARIRPRLAFAIMAIGIGLPSLLYSIYLTNQEPSSAYFVTTTRAWELAIGSGLAVFIQHTKFLSSSIRAGIGWAGLISIIIACLSFSETTSFPGHSALLPTMGAAAVIIAGEASCFWASDRFLRMRPMQYIGDISYSLYLWHWPLLILYTATFASPRSASWYHGLAVIGLAIVLAHFSKKLVEDPFRYGNWPRWNWLNAPGVIALASFGLVGMLAIGILFQVERYAGETALTIKLDPAMLTQPYDPRKATIPTPQAARKDNPDVYRLKCHANQRSTEPSSCIFGPPNAKRVVALVGDSHAAQWLPTLQEVYKGNPDWRIVTFTKSACAFNEAVVIIGKDRQPYETCTAWNQHILSKLKELNPEIVVISASSSYRVYGVEDQVVNRELLTNGLLARWEELLKTGARVVAIRDTPRMGKNIPECMSAPNATVDLCSTPRAKAVRNDDPIYLAIKRKQAEWAGKLSYLDMTEQFCDKTVCKPVKGQVLIWRDSHHMTATYARFLASVVAPYVINPQNSSNE